MKNKYFLYTILIVFCVSLMTVVSGQDEVRSLAEQNHHYAMFDSRDYVSPTYNDGVGNVTAHSYYKYSDKPVYIMQVAYSASLVVATELVHGMEYKIYVNPKNGQFQVVNITKDFIEVQSGLNKITSTNTGKKGKK